VLGAFVQGFRIEGRAFAGGAFDWATPFCLLTAIGLSLGYALLGASWLIIKAEGALQLWARWQARWLTAAVIVAMAAVSLATAFLNQQIAARWFSWPNILILSPVPLVTTVLAIMLWRTVQRGAEFLPFLFAIALFAMGYLGLAISLWPNIVPPAISLWDAAATPRSQAFLLLGTLFLLPVILGYTAWSYWVFRGKAPAGSDYH
jgi:cytochrome d ubiquinol oxidase subunit II